MVNRKDLIKIGEFARLASTNLRTLRYYEELGLLAPASRSAGGFRYYRHTDINRVQMIHDLQALGLHLDRIRDLMSAREAEGDRTSFLHRVREALVEHERLLVTQQEALEEQRIKVQTALGKLDVCHECDQFPQKGNNHCEPCGKDGEPLPPHLSALF